MKIMKLLTIIVGIGFAVLMVAGIVRIVREGMEARFYFSAKLFQWPALLAFVFFVLYPALDWLRGREFEWVTRFWAVLAVSGIFVVLYSLGFLIGLRRRRKREGIVGFAGS